MLNTPVLEVFNTNTLNLSTPNNWNFQMGHECVSSFESILRVILSESMYICRGEGRPFRIRK